MNILVLGGDQRQIEIINHLHKKEHKIDVVGFEKADIDEKINKINLNMVDISKYNVIIFPVSGVKENYRVVSDFKDEEIFLDPNFFKGIKDNTVVFTGVRTKYLNDMVKKLNNDVIVLMEDDEVIKENAIPTVEGIIGDLVYSTDHTINKSNIIILGYGNIGRLLAKRLNGLGANITFGIGLNNEYKVLKENNIDCFSINNLTQLKKVMNNCNIIINTIPSVVLNEQQLKNLNKDAYILDIASYPHGVDFKCADRLNIKNKLLLGIPGKTAPKTAGLILVKKINSNLERSKV